QAAALVEEVAVHALWAALGLAEAAEHPLRPAHVLLRPEHAAVAVGDRPLHAGVAAADLDAAGADAGGRCHLVGQAVAALERPALGAVLLPPLRRYATVLAGLDEVLRPEAQGEAFPEG